MAVLRNILRALGPSVLFGLKAGLRYHVTIAEELLSTRDRTVDIIAGRLGYSDASSFGTAFKRWKGVSPRMYRPRVRDQKSRLR